MPTAIAELLAHRCRTDGDMAVDEFIRLVLSHPQHGYYAQKDRLGPDGDFITAPEISQMFGEMAASFLSYIWHLSGAPDHLRCCLYEAGPGRGTLLTDMRRTYQTIAPELVSAPIYLTEASPHFRSVISQSVSETQPRFITSPDALPDLPVFGIANEFFDALGVRQVCYHQGRWHWRTIGLSEDEGSAFIFKDGNRLSDTELANLVLPPSPSEGDIAEFSPGSEQIISQLSQHISRFGGAVLIADYGKSDNLGDTVQAVKDHAAHPVLDDIGEADITHLVDFSALSRAAAHKGARLIGPVTQKDFLTELGIFERAEALRKSGSPQTDRMLIAALDRLTSPAQMGQIFKIAVLVPDGDGLPPGFSTASSAR